MGNLAVVLGIMFVVLKLVKVIAWPWVWVLAPFWVGIILWLIVVTIAAIVIVARK